ncbi:MAG: 3-phosphoshikimate 1-carboxyvinyltransferase [Bacteroidota bacterium]
MIVSLSPNSHTLQGQIPLPTSKSESNRALIIQHLASDSITLHNLAEARDTQTMRRLLESEGHVLDVLDAGTAMRFLTAYFTAVGRDQILTGTPRMCKRPIGPLIDALRELGGEIEYWKQEGFPPVHIISKGSKLKGGEIQMPGNISSQFISAILMVAPTLPEGVRLELTGKVSSRPYIDMTRRLMERFGVETTWETPHQLFVAPQAYRGGEYTIEADWSAASYWYSLVGMSESGKLKLGGLREHSFQGDQRIASLMDQYFGISTTYLPEGIEIHKYKQELPTTPVEIDCTEIPDMAQTFAVLAAATGVTLTLTGLHTLRIKETDRIEALETELTKLGANVSATEDTLSIHTGITSTSGVIHTYDDHRMAMAFAPLTMKLADLTIKDPEVVNKSYPSFWKHLEMAGIKVNEF